jgi:hypothetical protein
LKKGNGFFLGVGERQPTPNLCRDRWWGNTELGGGKLKKSKGLSKPNFDLLPNLKTFLVGMLVVFLLNRF